MIGVIVLVMGIEAPVPPALLDVSWTEFATGRATLVDIRATGDAPIEKLLGTFNGKPVIAYRASPDGKRWQAIAPVSLEAKPLPRTLAFNALLKDRASVSWKKPVPIVDAPYESRHITVGKQFMQPNKQQRARAGREQKALAAVLASSSSIRLWRGSFARPVTGADSSVFGTRRTYNKKRKSRHLGLDMDGDTGDPIVASGRGRVAMAYDRFYSGGTVVLDHGEGLFTMYFHMSRFDVKVGDVVEKGQLLGAVGASGQVTGPHLHFSVRLSGLYVDPQYFLALDLSADADDVNGDPIPLTPASPSPP